MALVLLHGGGDQPSTRAAVYGPLVEAVLAAPEPRLALVVCEADEASRAATATFYRDLFTSLGPIEASPLFATPAAPLAAEALIAAGPAAVLLCGGATPFYHEALCVDQAWLGYARERALPLAGTSAGTAILARHALVGGWRAERGGILRPMLFQGASEGLDAISVRPGLAVVDGAVDVHASQWGTLLRLIHAVDLGLAPAGWAIDENTALVFGQGEPHVAGVGHVYRVERTEGGSRVQLLTADA